MRVLVTQGDIDGGLRCQPCDCPVALAIKRAAPCVRPTVTASEILLQRQRPLITPVPQFQFIARWSFAEIARRSFAASERWSIPQVIGSFEPPAAVVAFVRAFDLGRPVLPFEFELPIELPLGEELA